MDVDSGSLYRTRWLMAHNRLHDFVHSKVMAEPDDQLRHWEAYLAELRTAEVIAAQPA
jgi:hypothetical protein